jgi:hypothetical protein
MGTDKSRNVFFFVGEGRDSWIWAFGLGVKVVSYDQHGAVLFA